MAHARVPCSAATVSDSTPAFGASGVQPRIVAFRLGILSAEEIQRLQARVITEHAVYSKNNMPKLHGPNDPALGPSDRRVRCPTCRNLWFSCPGHIGVVRLPVQLYHPCFLDATFKVLQTVCWCCSHLLGDKDDPKLLRYADARGIVKFHQTYLTGSNRFTCRSCGVPQPRYSKTNMVITRTWTPKQLATIEQLSEDLSMAAQRHFTPADALDIFQNIPVEDIRLLGMDPVLSHPAFMIMQNMVVLPPNARPAIMATEGSKRRGQDDITNQTQDVIKACQALRKAIVCTAPSAARRRKAGMNKRAAAATQAVHAAVAATAAAATGNAAPVPEEPQQDGEGESLAEFRVKGEFLGDFTEAEVRALRFALPDIVVTPSPMQAAAIWSAHPVACEKLQNETAVLFDNGGRVAPQSRQRTGAPKKAMTGRLAGKTGRVRGNLVAKRVDQNGRTVIVPDAELDIDELGVPEEFMRTLTVPEVVNADNMVRLTQAVRLGSGARGGAARVLLTTGELVQLTVTKLCGSLMLQNGDIVERHLRNGDWVLFNRQPSLHILSLRAFKVKEVPGRAFRVNLSVTTGFNADFDGDEMNMHVLQSIMANTEAQENMAASRHIMNPQNNAPAVSLVQDGRVGTMLLTQRTTRLDLNMMHQCVGAIRYPLPGKERMPAPAGTDERGQPFWTGRQLVTMILPPIFIEKRVRGAPADAGPDDPLDRYVLIENGVLLHGALCKATIGSGSGGICHRINSSFGPLAVRNFISDLQRIVYKWLPMHGLTMGLRDCMVPSGTRRAIQQVTEHTDRVVAELTREAHDLKTYLSPTEFARIEADVLNILSAVRTYTSRIVLTNDTPDADGDGPFGFKSMVAAGSKGNSDNVSQVMSCLGQQVVEGERVLPSASSGRTLCMFPPGAYSAAARGFVSHSYLTGMRPHEYYYHMMGGRMGLVAIAVQTAETGYKYRSMAKACENNVVQWDYSVRNAQGYIIEFIVGGDALSPTHVEHVPLPVLRMSNADIAAAFGSTEAERAAVARVCDLRDLMRYALLTPLYTDMQCRALMAFNPRDEIVRVRYELQHARTRFEDDIRPSTPEDLAVEVRCFADALLSHLPSAEAGAAMELALLWECRPSALAAAGINVGAFRHRLAPVLLQRLLVALAHPGESVGILAAQSIGEPSTQFTLNAFHQAGLFQRRMTVGVPRLTELLHASPRIHTPSMLVRYRDPTLRREHLERLASTLQFLCIDSVLQSSYPQFDPPSDGVHTAPTTLHKDVELMTHVVMLHGPEAPTLSPWIIRMVLARPVLEEHGFTPEMVARAIMQQMDAHNLHVVFSEPNMARWVLRIRIVDDSTEQGARALHTQIRERVLLGGICGVSHACVINTTRSVVDAETGGVREVSVPVIDTEGSALQRVATRDWADWENTVTNDVQEVVWTLGLVAARAVLFAELDRVVTYDGGYVDARHLNHIVDSMTHRGYMMPLTRHGINRVDFGPMQRATYEEPTEMLQQGALTAEMDMLRDMCGNIVFGQKPPIGTGTVAIQQDLNTPAAYGERRIMPGSRELAGGHASHRKFRASVAGQHTTLRNAAGWSQPAPVPESSQHQPPAAGQPYRRRVVPPSSQATQVVVTGVNGTQMTDADPQAAVVAGYGDTHAKAATKATRKRYRPSSPTAAMLAALSTGSGSHASGAGSTARSTRQRVQTSQ